MASKTTTTMRRPTPQRSSEGTMTDRVLAALKSSGEPMRVKSVAEALDAHQGSVNATLARLVDDGQLKRIEPGLYDLKSRPKKAEHAKPAINGTHTAPPPPPPVSTALVTPAEKQRRERTVWTDDMWKVYAEQVFLEFLEDPAAGVTMKVLNIAMKKAIPEPLWRDNISGLSIVPKLVEHLKPLMQNLVNNWLDPQLVEKTVPQAVDVEEVLRHVPTERLMLLLNERQLARQNDMFSRFDTFLVQGNALLGAISEEVAKKLKVDLRLGQAEQKEAPVVPKTKVFVCGVKSGRMAEIKQKLSGFNLEWGGEFVVDSSNTSQVSAKDVPRNCDIYLINAKQSSHVMQQSVFAAVGRDRTRFVNGSHDLESTLRDIHVHGAERVLKMPSHRIPGTC